MTVEVEKLQQRLGIAISRTAKSDCGRLLSVINICDYYGRLLWAITVGDYCRQLMSAITVGDLWVALQLFGKSVS